MDAEAVVADASVEAGETMEKWGNGKNMKLRPKPVCVKSPGETLTRGGETDKAYLNAGYGITIGHHPGSG